MKIHLEEEDSLTLEAFREEWRSVGWGVWADCYTDIPYGEDFKFFGALFTPRDYAEKLIKQREDARQLRSQVVLSPFESHALPDFSILGYEQIYATPNFVQHATAAGLCLAAVTRATEIYPGEMLSPSKSDDLASN